MNINGYRTDHQPVIKARACRGKGRRAFSGPEPLEQRIAPATFVVINTNDSGPGSLRDAIAQANSTTGLDTINFNIGGTGVHVIQLQPATGALPVITDAVVINGYSQPGSVQNTLAFNVAGTNAVPTIVLDGSLVTGGDGLALTSGGSTIAGLVIQGFDGAGIRIAGSSATNNLIVGNFIGTDATGKLAKSNDGGGVIASLSANNTIGSANPAGRNLISGNGAYGILLDSMTAAQGPGTLVLGNLIGLSAAGAALGNSGPGVAIRDASGQQIGGNSQGQGNFISFNAGDGIAVGISSPQPETASSGNLIRGNFIANNAGLGINLGRDGVTLNDPGDVDTGANGRINFPLIQSADVQPTITVLNGVLRSSPNTTFEVEFFASGTADPTAFGEGAKPLGTIIVSTDSSGQAPINFTSSGDYRGQVFTATSTNISTGDTSEFSLAFSPLMVTTAADTVDPTDGLTSLREAIAYANSNPDFSTITFNIPGSGVQSIKPATRLPDIVQPAFIDGYSQPGASPNTLDPGNNAVLLIELDGSTITAGTSVYGLTLTGGGSTVRGLVVKSFFDGGINITGAGGNVIVGNWIGTNADGLTAPAASNRDGIDIFNSPNNTIGGTAAADHNVISGNSLYPINIRGGSASIGNVIKGNAIGTTKDGTAPLGNGGELYLNGDGTILGTSEVGGRNVISTSTPGPDAVAIYSPGVVVRHNSIGIDLTGSTTFGVGGAGIHVFAPSATIGGTGSNDGNLIAGAALGGIVIESDGAVVQGNLIGTDFSGTLPRPNAVAGIVIARGTGNTIGGTGAGAANILGFNNGDGIWISGSTGAAGGNAVRGNSIFGNSGLGIDLGPDGVTANDALDGDTGANTLQNFPVLTGAVRDATGTVISGSLNSTANAVFTIDFYASNAGDPSGFGEGRTYLGSITTGPTGATGDVAFNFSPSLVVPPGSVITATATNSANNTSEFSAIRLLSTVFVWDAGGGSDLSWDNALNWDIDVGFPGPVDTAILKTTSTINLPSSRSVGNFQQSSGTFTSPAGVTLSVLNAFDWTGGSQGGAGTTQVAFGAVLNLAGTSKGLSRTLINDGTTNWIAGAVSGAGPFTNFGVFHANANDFFGPTFNSSATATFSQESGSNLFNRPFNNSGAVKVLGGSVEFSAGGTSGGTFNVATGAALTFRNGPFQFNGAAFTGTGDISLLGTITLDAATTYNVAGTTTVAFAGTTTFNTSSTATFGTLNLTNAVLNGSSNMVVSSVFTWDRGTLGGAGTTTIAPGATSTWATANAKTLDRAVINNGTFAGGNITGAGSVMNNGVFNTSATSSMGVAFTNSATGTFNQQAGNYTFSAPFTNQGAINCTGGTLTFNGGMTQLGGVTSLAGGNLGGAFTLQGGILTGAGTLAGALTNTGGTVRPGGSGAAGTISVSGNFTQSGSGTLAVDLGGTAAGQFDVLAVGGTATLGGTLNVTNINGFVPVAGNQFRVVTSTNNPGTFSALTGATTGLSQVPDNSGLILQANALVYTWDGGAGPGNTSWFEPLNWDLDSGFPGPADTAILSNAANNTITIPSSLSVGTFKQSAGLVTSTGGITFTILNTFDWSGGTEGGAGATTIPAGAALNLSTGSTILNGRVLNIGGAAIDSVAGGTLTLSNGAVMNVSGTFDLQTDDDILAGGTGTSITVMTGGVLKKTGGTLTTEIQPVVTINGSIISQLGTLRLDSVLGGNNPTFNASSGGSIIELFTGNGAFSGTTTVTGGGVTRVIDANLQFLGPVALSGAGTNFDIAGTGTVNIGNTLSVPVGTVLSLATGTLTGAGTIDVAGSFGWTSGALRGSGVMNIQPGGILNMAAPNAKTLSVRTINDAGDAGLSGSLALENGATFNLAGHLDLLNDADLVSSSSGSFVVQSGGLLRKFSGAGLSDIAAGVAVTNSGTIEVDTGALRIGNAAGGNSATFSPFGSALLEIAGGNGSFTGNTNNSGANGTLRFSGGVMQFGGPVSFTGSGAQLEVAGGAVALSSTLTTGAGTTLALSAGGIGGAGNIDILGALDWTGGAMTGSGTTTIAALATATLSGSADKQLVGRALVNAGTLNWSGIGQIAMNNATISNSGTFNLQSDAVMAITGGSPVFNNLGSGTLTKSGGAGTSTFSIGIAVNNAGTISAQSGTLDLGSSFIQSAGATLLGPGGLASPGTLTFQAGELRGTGTISGGVNNVGATVRPGGTGVAGAIAITGAYTQGAGATLAMEIGGLNAGTQYDQLNVGGTATLGGAFQVSLLGGFVPPSGSQFQLLNSNSRSGTFATESIAPGLTRQYTPTGVLLVGPAPPPSTVVTTALDIVDNADGLVSLREAILFANSNSGIDTITFNIPGAGVQTILLTAALPTITDPVVIDGYTQPGALANTLTGGDNAVLLIELNGSNAVSVSGLSISAGGSTVRGLALNGFGGQGAIYLTGAGGNVVTGNFIGTNAAGLAAGPANYRGVFVSGSSSNVIGGTSPGDRNIISASQHIGVDIAFGASSNLVQGNFIGTDKTGKVALGNVDVGVFINDSPGNVIGGTTAGARNVISGQSLTSGSQGVSIAGGAGATGNLVQGNFIGTDVTGTVALGNATGVFVGQGAQGNTVGGNVAGAGNVISGNGLSGVQIADAGTSNNRIAGNFIGTDAVQVLVLGNGGRGVLVANGASGNFIGGTNAGDGNVITHNGLEGVAIISGNANAVLGNAIFANSGIELDLGGDGVTPNDVGDGDGGANDLQNFPVITQATPDVGGTRINGTFNGAVNASFRIEFFQSDTADGSGAGEAKVFLGFQDITTDGSGNASFTLVVPTAVGIGQFVTAIATNSTLNDSSEFAAAKIVQPPANASIADAIVVEGDSGTKMMVFHVTLDRAAGSTVTVNYSTSDRTAAAGLDYDFASGVVTFGPTDVEQTFVVTIHGDTLAEFRERFAVTLSNPQGIGIKDGDALGVIQDDDHHSLGIGQGNGNSFRVYTVNGAGATFQAELQPFASGYKGGVRVAVGDVTGDGVDDFIAGAGLGGRGRVRVYDGVTLNPLDGTLGDFSAYGDFYRGGVFVAAGDVNGDGRADIIVSPSAGSHNEVRIFSGVDGSLLSSFQALGRGSGGVRVAAGDVNGDGLADIIVGAGLESKVRIFDALSGTLMPGGDFSAFDRSFHGGVFVASGDINNDGIDDLIVSGGSKSATIKIFPQGVSSPPTSSFSAYTGALRGVHVAAGDINGDGIADIIATKGSKTDGKIRVFQGASLAELFNFTPFGRASAGNYLG